MIVLVTLAVLAAGALGAFLGWCYFGGERTKVRSLPPEIRAQLEGCRRCNLSELVCREHLATPAEACKCGGMPVPCPDCRADCYSIPELLEENARLRMGLGRPW